MYKTMICSMFSHIKGSVEVLNRIAEWPAGTRTVSEADAFVARFCRSLWVCFCLVFVMPLCASVYLCLVVTCWERADLLALVCGVYL